MRYFSPDLDISTFNRPFHTILRAERSAHVFQRRNEPRNSKTAMIRRFCRKYCVISLPSQILRRLSALFTLFYVKNVSHTFSSAETSPERQKSQLIVDFAENYALFLSRLRYCDIQMLFSLTYTCRTQCTGFPAPNQVKVDKNLNHSQILTKIMRYFFPVLDIATTKRPLHTILREERIAHVFQRRNKPRTSKIAIIRRF